MRQTVGKSSRTPGKHAALDKYLGKQAGVISYSFPNRSVWFIDCTAGDGQAEDFDRHTSPGILLRHADWLREKNIDVHVQLYERSERNANLLTDIVGDRAQVIQSSSEQMEPKWNPGDVVFISNDPNTISDWALPYALRYAPELTTVFSTLGCNVGGLKRLPIDQRQQWYQHLSAQAQLLKHWHDMMLVSLVGDASQWAYCVNSPARWRQELSGIFRSAFDAAGYSTESNWLKKDRVSFVDHVDRLFLTKEEYRNARK